MSDIIEKARARRGELMLEVGRIDELLARHRSLAAEMAAILSGPDATPRARKRATSQETDGRKRGPNGGRPDAIVAFAKAAIIEAGRPLTRSDLIPLIEAQGELVGGTDKARNLGTILWRSKRFNSTGEGYWPQDVERPSASSDGSPFASLDL